MDPKAFEIFDKLNIANIPLTFGKIGGVEDCLRSLDPAYLFLSLSSSSASIV